MNKATVEKYAARITKIEQMGKTRRMYHVGDSFCIEIGVTFCDLKSKGDLMRQWWKAGYVAKPLSSFLWVDTYFRDSEGWWMKYNPTVKRSDDGKRMMIDFDHLKEATPENERELVAECIRLAAKDGAI